MPISHQKDGLRKIPLSISGDINGDIINLSIFPIQQTKHRVVIINGKIISIGGESPFTGNNNPITNVLTSEYYGGLDSYSDCFTRPIRTPNSTVFALPNRNTNYNPKFNYKYTGIKYYIYTGV